MAPRAPQSVPKALQERPFLCVLSPSLIEAIPVNIVSGWAGVDTFRYAGARSESNAVQAAAGRATS
eukprot:4016827-Pyramimonas_sp.AAC.1